MSVTTVHTVRSEYTNRCKELHYIKFGLNTSVSVTTVHKIRSEYANRSKELRYIKFGLNASMSVTTVHKMRSNHAYRTTVLTVRRCKVDITTVSFREVSGKVHGIPV